MEQTNLPRGLDRIEPFIREQGDWALARQSVTAHRFKADQTYITAVDHKVESALVEFITGNFPAHRLLGEEGGFRGNDNSRWTWVIDPVDGTSNYALGLPLWAVSVGLLEDGRPKCGWIYLPAQGEMFQATTGRGAFLNGGRIHCGSGSNMRPQDLFGVDTRSLTGFDFSFPQDARSLGSAALAVCYAACGRLVGYFLTAWYLWDIAAALIIALEAGLRVTTLDNNGFNKFGDLDHQRGASLLFARPELHQKLLTAIATKPKRVDVRRNPSPRIGQGE